MIGLYLSFYGQINDDLMYMYKLWAFSPCLCRVKLYCNLNKMIFKPHTHYICQLKVVAGVWPGEVPHCGQDAGVGLAYGSSLQGVFPAIIILLIQQQITIFLYAVDEPSISTHCLPIIRLFHELNHVVSCRHFERRTVFFFGYDAGYTDTICTDQSCDILVSAWRIRMCFGNFFTGPLL